jgi:predicted PurR-regulated permease PerM
MIVAVVVFGVLAASLAAAVPPLMEEARQFIADAPRYLQHAQDHSALSHTAANYRHDQQHGRIIVFRRYEGRNSGIRRHI